MLFPSTLRKLPSTNLVPFNSNHTKTKHSNVNNATISKMKWHVATIAQNNDHDNTKISPTDVEIVDAQTAATLPTRGKYVDKKRCSSSLQNGLCSDFAPAPGCGLMRSALLAHISFVKFCHGAAPSSLCGLAWLPLLDLAFGVISRCLCV